MASGEDAEKDERVAAPCLKSLTEIVSILLITFVIIFLVASDIQQR